MKHLVVFFLALMTLVSCSDDDTNDNSANLSAEARALSLVSSFETSAAGNIRVQVGSGINKAKTSPSLTVLAMLSKDGQAFTDATVNFEIVGDLPVGFADDNGFILQGVQLDQPIGSSSTLTFDSNNQDLFPSFEREVQLVNTFDLTGNYTRTSDIALGDDIIFSWTPDVTRDHQVLVGVCTSSQGCDLFSVDDADGTFVLAGEYVVSHATIGESIAVAVVRGYQDCFNVDGTDYCIHSYADGMNVFRF